MEWKRIHGEMVSLVPFLTGVFFWHVQVSPAISIPPVSPLSTDIMVKQLIWKLKLYSFHCKERWLHIKLVGWSTSCVLLLCGERRGIFLPTNGRVSQVYDYGEQRVAFISQRRVIIIALQIYGLLLERTYQQSACHFSCHLMHYW